MTIALAQGSSTGNSGIVSPWLGGSMRAAVTTPVPTADIAASATREALVAVPTREGVVIIEVPDGVLGPEAAQPSQRRGLGALDTGRRGASIAAEQAKLESSVQRIQAKFAALGIRDSEGNSPVTAVFRPKFPNAAYAPKGLDEYDLPRDSIGVGIDPRSGRSFGEAEDVVAHELAHRIIDHMTHKPLSMHPLSEDVAVHESLADTFAALVDDDQEWVLGEDLVKPVRIMNNPESLGHPGHVDDLKQVLRPGGPHMHVIGQDSRTGEDVEAPDWHVVAGIPNKAAAIIGSELGKDTLGKIYIKAVRDYVAPGREVEGLAAAVLKSTNDLYGAASREMSAVRDAWDAVGVLDLLKQQASARR
jgi:hypothetical protein